MYKSLLALFQAVLIFIDTAVCIMFQVSLTLISIQHS